MKLARRDLLTTTLAAAAGAALWYPGTALAQAPAGTPPGFSMDRVHPDLRGAAAALIRMGLAGRDTTAANLTESRVGMARFSRPPVPDVPYRMQRIPGAKGQPDVTVYIVNGAAVGVKDGGSRPAILHTHGGGFVVGTASGALYDLQLLCKALDCVAITVDYRLAPETTYAGSIEDNYAGLKWLHANAAILGADPSRIAVMGESAGGGHAALLALTARDRGEVPVMFQCLTYPMLDDRTGSSRAVPPHVGELVWTPGSNRFGWESFLGQKPGLDTAPRDAVPARVADLAGLPPAFIGVGTLDLFAQEDTEYARRLNLAGVPTELIVVPGAFHGFDSIGAMTKAPIAAWFNAAREQALRTAFYGAKPA